MWFLVLIFLNAAGNPTQLIPIEPYPTLEECQTAKDKVDADMRKSYPKELDSFKMECLFAKKPKEIV